ncbi:hypothetical protein Bca4012_058356 [Brassica carinata]
MSRTDRDWIVDGTTLARTILAHRRGDLGAARPCPRARWPRCGSSSSTGEVVSVQLVLDRGRGGLGAVTRPRPWAKWPRCGSCSPTGEVASVRLVLAHGRGGLGVVRPRPRARWPRPGPSSPTGEVASCALSSPTGEVASARPVGDLGPAGPRPRARWPRSGSSLVKLKSKDHTMLLYHNLNESSVEFPTAEEASMPIS